MAAVDPAVVEAARTRHAAARAAGLNLDMTRGKPSPEQLARSHGLLAAVAREDDPAADGTDCRNYGGDPRGLPELRAIFGEILGVDPDLVFVGGNASLQWMHDFVVQAMLVGVPGGDPWGGPGRPVPVRFLCPCPGYDRHFAVLERYGIEMLLVAMGDEGPDMDEVARLAGSDPNVKGMFCVPRYSNPTGVTCSDEVVEAIASMSTAAPDFRVIWDDAYALHAFDGEPDRLASLYDRCAAHGNEDRALLVSSFSKVTFGGSGLAAVAASPANGAWIRASRQVQTIGPNKLNQLAHAHFFDGSVSAVRDHMKGTRGPDPAEVRGRPARARRAPRRPWDRLLEPASRRATSSAWTRRPVVPARWSRWRAKQESKLTPAGATFPYGIDPRDRNIRIAPTLPALDEIETATGLLADCIVLVSAGE